MEQVVVGIDVGTTKVTTVVAAASSEDIQIVGVGILPSRGFQSGFVRDHAAVTSAIVESVRLAECTSGIAITNGYVGVSDVSPRILDDGSRSESEANRIQHVIAAVEQLDFPSIPQSRSVKQGVSPGKSRPRRSTKTTYPSGQLLQNRDVHPVRALADLSACFDAAGIEIRHVIPKAVAASEAVLAACEGDAVRVLVDLGGSTTEIAVFDRNRLVHTAGIPVGGQQLSTEIATRLGIPIAQAEQLKRAYGHAATPRRRRVACAAALHEERERLTPVAYLEICEAVDVFLQRTFAWIANEVQHAVDLGLRPGEAILVGGTAQLVGMREFATDQLQMSVRLGVPEGIRSRFHAIHLPEHATALGLALWGVRKEEDGEIPPSTIALPDRLFHGRRPEFLRLIVT